MLSKAKACLQVTTPRGLHEQAQHYNSQLQQYNGKLQEDLQASGAALREAQARVCCCAGTRTLEMRTF